MACPRCSGTRKLAYDPRNPYGVDTTTKEWDCPDCPTETIPEAELDKLMADEAKERLAGPAELEAVIAEASKTKKAKGK